jgi:hypothetical protein
MKAKENLPLWLQKLVLKQERRLRREYEEQYLCECGESGVIPLRYAQWRLKKLEPQVVEVLLEENEIKLNGDQKCCSP